MPKVSRKRQITLPVAECEELGIAPGDDVEILRYRDQFNIRKKTPAAAAGILKGTKIRKEISDRESLLSNFE